MRQGVAPAGLDACLRRAVGEYAGQEGRPEEGAQAVSGFFKALEAYDYALLQVNKLSKE